MISSIAILLAGCVTGPVGPTANAADPLGPWQDAREKPFVDPATLDPTVPTPVSIIGHVTGDGAVRYDPLIRYLTTLADASPRVTMTPYAKSHEDRTLYYLTITSEANHARLDDIKAANAKLADPRLITDPSDAERIIESTPGIAWMAYSIHGDELSSTDAAVQLAYTLAAGTDDATQRMREELVINIDPLMNPDGRERFLSQLQHLSGKVINTDYQAMQHRGLWSAGRGNHYLFDLNRDWLMQVHPETRGRAAAILEWNPHMLVDSHEMGSLDTYLFDPPREPYNVDLSEDNLQWRRLFSADQAKAFDAHGWSYYTGEWYEEWYPGYTNAFANLLGAIGILYEQAGVNAAAVKQPAGQVLTYREAVHHQFVSSMANLESLRANRKAVLTDYHADRRWAVSARPGSDREVLLLPPRSSETHLGSGDATYTRFVELLGHNGIESSRTSEPITARNAVDIWGDRSDAVELPAGTLVVRAAQPHRRLLNAALGFDPHMSDAFLLEERKDLENHRGTRVYDITAWNLPMAYGLDAYWAESIGEFTADDSPGSPAPAIVRPKPVYGYLIDGHSSDIYRAVVRLLDNDCKLRLAVKPFAIAGVQYEPGAILLRGHENPDNLPDLLEGALADADLHVRRVDTALSDSGPDLGGGRFVLLDEPRIAIASQWPISTTSFGSTWQLLDDRVGLRVSPINLQALGRIDLRRYNVLVLPNAWGSSSLGAVLNDRVRKKLVSWLRSGGTLIAMGGSAAFVAGKDNGLGSVRLKRDVLDKLDDYKEALAREKAARNVQVDPEAVWGTKGTADDAEARGDTLRLPGGAEYAEIVAEHQGILDGRSDKKGAPPKIDALKREDAWQRIFRPRGVFAEATLNPEHWLCFGLGERLPVLLAGSSAFMSSYPVATPARLTDAADLRLSGLFWPEARERWANTAYSTVERVGNGQIILFASDPFFRGYLEGSGRLFLNALVYGPGLGTSTAVPW